MDLTEHRLSRETIYEGKILHIYRDDVLLPNGRKSVREVADHPGGVAIVALDENDNVLTVKQYRYVFPVCLRRSLLGSSSAAKTRARPQYAN